MKKHIILVGAESQFLQRLGDYVNNKGEAEAFLCVRAEELAGEVKRREAAVVFYMEGFSGVEDIDVESVPLVTNPLQEDGIYQFQSAGSLYKAMQKYIWKERPCRPVPPGERKICAVYSPLGRSGKTSFACAYAREHSFFYIGMEEYGFNTNDFCNRGSLLYHMKGRNKDIISFLLTYAEDWEGVRVFGSPTLFTDIRSIDAEDYRWFLEEIRRDKRMPSVMMDFGSGCLTDYEILDYFDQVYVPIVNGSTEERKMKQFKELLYEANGRMEGKLTEIMVPSLPWSSPEFLKQIRYMDGLTYE